MILEKTDLQTAQEWIKSYIELIASYVHPKSSNHLLSHLRAIMVLDHRRLIRPGKKIRPNFYKILPTNLGACNHPFIPFIHHSWGETVLWGTVFIIQISDKMQYFTILQYKLQSFNIQDDRSTRGLLAKPLKRFPKSPIRPAGFYFCSASCCRVFEWTLIELRSNIINNLLCLFFI